MWLGKLNMFNMIQMGWLGRKTSMQTNADKDFFFQQEISHIFFEKVQNLCCEYPLEAPHWDASNEYP